MGFTLTGHIRIVNDPLDLVPLLITFNDPDFKLVYSQLTKNWMTEEELSKEADSEKVRECIILLKKGNLIEEKWRMPKPGGKPAMEFKTTYSKFRANFQCPMDDLGDIIHISVSNNGDLRNKADEIIKDVRAGNNSVNDIGRKYGISPVFVKGLAKRIPNLEVKGQGLIFVEKPE
ncbi:transcriptional regulator, ArsR family [Methanoplanus limicola DSM 2279]|uniref:Transcriptional regulator, ArsR family n=1 Tax=Methanoplanus limicola DSM 2279 TaxID=937775 RepID=H1Z479_9EURY|nr:transcriptional regulator, ArsR family [Methanoplanus limicola DSM 2279]